MQFKVAKPNQEVRLRQWDPGRVAQVRVFLSNLETATNRSLAAQVQQSPKRKFSEFVPKIVSQDITTEIEFREIRVFFKEPKGLKNFLFYEFAFSGSSKFFEEERFVSYEPSFVFPDLQDAAIYFMRVRVVTKDGLVGPWSETINVTTPSAKVFGLFSDTLHTLNVTLPTFTQIFATTYTALGGTIYYSIQYRMTPLFGAGVQHADIEFQWLVDGAQNGQNMIISVYGGAGMEVITNAIGSFPDDSLLIFPLTGNFKIIKTGALIQKTSTMTQGDHTIALFARILPANYNRPDAFQPGNTFPAPINYGGSAFMELNNFNIFEVTTGA
jgi:hypothetical protein